MDRGDAFAAVRRSYRDCGETLRLCDAPAEIAVGVRGCAPRLQGLRWGFAAVRRSYGRVGVFVGAA